MLLSVAGGVDRRSYCRWRLASLLPILVMGVFATFAGTWLGLSLSAPGALATPVCSPVFGWQRVEALRLDLRRPMLWTTVASVVLLPVHGWMTYRMVASQAVPDQKNARMAADIAIVDSAPYSANLVINAPDLSNRPIRLQGWTLRPADIAALCGTRWIAFVDAPQLDSLNVYYNDKPVAAPSPHQRLLHAAARNADVNVDQGVRSPIAAATAGRHAGQL